VNLLFEHTVPINTTPVRLIDYALKVIETLPTRSGAKKAIKRGQLLLNGKPAIESIWVKPGMRLTHIQDENSTKKGYKFSVEVIFEDEYLAVVNKPAGLPVSGNFFRTLENALPYNLKKTAHKNTLVQPLPVHRVDASTSGLVLVAKTSLTRIALGQQFEQQAIQKTYHAVVIGKPGLSGVIDQSIDSKPAKSSYEVLISVRSLKYDYLSLVKLMPFTGRTHQLRIHCAKMEHPILGDKLYTPEELLFKGKGLFLAATGISFVHPETQKTVDIEIPLPLKFTALLKRENSRWERLNQQQ
jgi:RluA family pseudouridine synthase